MAESRKKSTKVKDSVKVNKSTKVKENVKANDKLKVSDIDYDHIGALTFDDKVIKKIVGYSTCAIPGVLAMSGSLISGIADALKFTEDEIKGISADVDEKVTKVDIKVICEYGHNIPLIYKTIVDKASAAVTEMTGLRVVELNVHVTDILTKEDFERKKKNTVDEE